MSLSMEKNLVRILIPAHHFRHRPCMKQVLYTFVFQRSMNLCITMAWSLSKLKICGAKNNFDRAL